MSNCGRSELIIRLALTLFAVGLLFNATVTIANDGMPVPGRRYAGSLHLAAADIG